MTLLQLSTRKDRRTWLPAAKRLIAIGDIHGDLTKACAALQVAQVIDEHDRCIDGETVVVQVWLNAEVHFHFAKFFHVIQTARCF